MATPPKNPPPSKNDPNVRVRDAEERGKIAGEIQSVGGRISRFIELLRPYRDLLALLIGVVISISAVTSWITTYFATRSQVSHLECRTKDYIYSATKPLKSNLGRIIADWDTKEAMRLLEDSKQNAAALRLLEESRVARAALDKADGGVHLLSPASSALPVSPSAT
jgi:hypothetical protein